MRLDEPPYVLQGQEGLVGRQSLPQQVVTASSEQHQNEQQSGYIQPIDGVLHAHLFHEEIQISEDAVLLGLGAVQLLPALQHGVYEAL